MQMEGFDWKDLQLVGIGLFCTMTALSAGYGAFLAWALLIQKWFIRY